MAPGVRRSREVVVTSSVVPVGSLLWRALLAIGVVNGVVGVAVLVWPDVTLAVLAVLVGIQLVLAGLLRLLMAAADAGQDARLLNALLGLVGVGIGLLVMREPLRSVGAIVTVLGIFWVLWGLVELFVAMLPAARDYRLPLGVEGAVAAIGGTALLAWPAVTVLALTVLVGLLLVGVGIAAVWAGWRLRGLDVTATA